MNVMNVKVSKLHMAEAVVILINSTFAFIAVAVLF